MCGGKGVPCSFIIRCITFRTFLLFLFFSLLYLQTSFVLADDTSAETFISHTDSSTATTTGVAAAVDSGLPPIYVLNLDRSKERWRKTQQQLKKAGLSEEHQVTRLSAVDGRALTNDELKAKSSRMAMYFQPRGVIGCYLSHVKFWQLVVQQQHQRAIVFEDDIQLVDGFTDKLKAMLQQIPIAAADKEGSEDDDFDVMLLGAIGRVHPEGKDNFGSLLFSAYIGGNRKFRRLGDAIYQPQRPAGTHAYMVSLKGAEKLLRLCPKATYHVDLDAWRHAGLNIRMFYPMLAYQTFEDTVLTEVNYKRSGINKMLVESRPVQRIHAWAKDPHTMQPWSHVLAEPILQFGPGGPVLTVERHLIIVAIGTAAASAFNSFGYKLASKYMYGGVFGFMLSVRLIIWALMNWKT